MTARRHAALIVVDIQNDFLDEGALPVPGGRDIIERVNALGSEGFGAVIATQDWHPDAHCSFRPQGGDWPIHCVAGTPGADFPATLDQRPITHIIRKGTQTDRDSYSGFLDNDRVSATGLDGLLKGLGISTLTLTGLALDYCVAATATDAARLGYDVRIDVNACRGIATDHTDLFRIFSDAGITLIL